MTMAAAIEGRTAETPAWSKASRIASVDILHDLVQAEAIWRSLEDPRQFSTPYQRFEFLGAWQRQVGVREGLSPFIVVAYDVERRPLLLLPLALRHTHGVRTACFMGGKHATFNMALWDREFAGNATADDLDALISGIRAQSGADVLELTQQPLRWRRRRLKGKERKLQALPGYRYCVAETDAEVKRMLDAFFRIKPLRMAEQKLPNVFAEPGVEDFIRTACMAPLAGGGHAIDIHVLECDDEVISMFAGVADGHRFSMMFNTYTMSDNSRYSPGLILMRNIVDHYAERGYRALDLGIGSDEYKRLFCKDDEPIFDSFIPLSLRGQLAATAMSGVNRAKHLVKHNQTLFQLAQKMRSALHR